MVPFQLQGISAIMSLGVLSRPSITVWNEEHARQLREIAEILVTKAGQYSKGSSRQTDQVEMMRKLQRVEAYADQVRLEYAQLKAKYDLYPHKLMGQLIRQKAWQSWRQTKKTCRTR